MSQHYFERTASIAIGPPPQVPINSNPRKERTMRMRRFSIALAFSTLLLVSIASGQNNISGGNNTFTQPSTESVDMRHYMAPVIGGTLDDPGTKLCRSDNYNFCLTSLRDNAGETQIVYSTSLGIVDYIAISSYNHGSVASPVYYIGVARNQPGPNYNGLRCFSTNNELCSAPVNSLMMPEGVPYQISALPVVSYSTVLSASNADLSPSSPIPGAMLTTPNSGDGNYWLFETWNMAYPPPCVQTSAGNNYETKVLVAYVPNVPFGDVQGGDNPGSIGTQDAVVVDTFSIGPPREAERYFYVKDLGRVREGHSTYDSRTGLYDLDTNETTWGVQLPINQSGTGLIPRPIPDECPQGSFIRLY